MYVDSKQEDTLENSIGFIPNFLTISTTFYSMYLVMESNNNSDASVQEECIKSNLVELKRLFLLFVTSICSIHRCNLSLLLGQFGNCRNEFKYRIYYMNDYIG